MNNLGPLFFLLSAFTVVAAYHASVAAYQASAFLIRGRTIRQLRLPALVAFTIFCIGLLALLVFVDLSDLETDMLPAVQSYAIYISIGILFGAALLRWLRPTDNAALNLQWGFACLIIMTTGLFFQDIRRLIRGAEGIETPLISFTLPPQTTYATDTLPAYDSGPEIAPSFGTTEFQAGIAGFARISLLATRDVETMQTISQEFFSTPNAQSQRDDNYKLQEFVVRLQDIADVAGDSTDLIHKCLVPYAELFPDGLPIQDELADIGANIGVFAAAEYDKIGYGIARVHSRGAASPSEENIEEILVNRILTKWIDVIQSQATQDWLPTSLREYCAEISGKVRAGFRDLLWDLDTNDFPYRVMLASTAMLAAGYPMSSAIILARWLTHNRAQMELASVRERELLARTLFHIRALTELDYVLSSAQRYVLEERVLAELSKYYEQILEVIFGSADTTWASGACPERRSDPVRRLMFGRIVTMATYLSVRSEKLEVYDTESLRSADELATTSYDCYSGIVENIDVYRGEFYIAAAQAKIGYGVELDPLTTSDMRERIQHLEEARDLLREVVALRHTENAMTSEERAAEAYQDWILSPAPNDQRPDRLLRYVTDTLHRIEESN